MPQDGESTEPVEQERAETSSPAVICLPTYNERENLTSIVEELLRQSGARDEIPHQNEQRHHRQLVIDRRFERFLADGRQRTVERIRERKPDEPDDRHRERDRHAQERQREQEKESEKGEGHVSPTGLSAGCT